MVMRESTLEREFVRRIKSLGGLIIKLTTAKGLPDRLVLLPGGQMHLVELKTEVGRPSPAQRVWHERAASIGIRVHVLYGPEEVRGWIRERYAELDRAEGLNQEEDHG